MFDSADSRGASPEVADSRGAESGGAGSGGAGSWGADTGGAASPSGGGVQLRHWVVRRGRVPGAWSTGAGGAGGAGAAGAGGARAAGAGDIGAAGVGGARAGGAGGARAAGAGGAGVAGAGGAGAGGTKGPRDAIAGGAGGTGAACDGGTRAAGAGATDGTGTAPHRPFFYPQPQSSLSPPNSALHQVFSVPSSCGLTPPLLYLALDQSQPLLLPGSPLPAPSPYPAQTSSLAERCEPESRPASPVRTVSRAHHYCPPPVPATHDMALRPSSVPQHVALPSPQASSLPDVPDPGSNLALAVSPSVTRLLATIVTDPSFESTIAFALVTEQVDSVATRRLDYVESLFLAVVLPRFASMLLCPEGDPDALDIPTPCSYAEAIMGEYSSQWQTAMDAEMASWKSTGTYVDEVPPPGANIVNGMWIFRVKRPPGSPPAFKVCYVAPGFRQ
ncbi:unnamed protein product [Closterium sp. NIES-54]